jgi:TonB-like protein
MQTSSPAPALLAPRAEDAPLGKSVAIGDRYAFAVRVVDEPPSPVFLLARFSEPPGDSCEERLTAHARGLGANRLYVHRGTSCTGSAFFVRTISPPANRKTGESPADASTPDASLGAWVHDRWHRPASISPEESRRLCVVVQFTVSPLQRVWRVNGTPIRASGNHEFDESVRAALESAIDERATVPAPPRDLVGEHVDYRVEFTEGDPRICRQPTP